MENVFHSTAFSNEICEFEGLCKTSCIVDARNSFELGREHILSHRDNMRARIKELSFFLNHLKNNSKEYLATKEMLYIGHASRISLSLYQVNFPKYMSIENGIKINEILAIFKYSWRKICFEVLERILLEETQIPDNYLSKLSKPRKDLVSKSRDRFAKDVAAHINEHLGEYLFDVILSDNITKSDIYEDFPDSYRDHFEFEDNWKLESQLFDGLHDYGFDQEKLGSIVNSAFCQSLDIINKRMLSIKKRIARNSHRHLLSAVLKKGSAANDCAEGLAIFSSAVVDAKF